jgi:menaquinol-cytochrome c reductase iron-sulfur subunit
MNAREHQPDRTPRRGFLTRTAAVVAGTLAGLVPLITGAAAALDPLRRRGLEADLVMVTKLGALPENGMPKSFVIEADRVDAWTTQRSAPVGAVYLRRTRDGVIALNVVCPHAGCFVGLASDRSRFACPCHGSSFDLDGAINDPASPSPRDMDELEVEVRNGDEVWVRYQNFLPGRKTRESV